MIFLGGKYLEDADSNPIKCCVCSAYICIADEYGQTGFNYKVKYFCEKCALGIVDNV